MKANAPKERPILFSGGMVRAILDGSKTQTRRVIRGNPYSVRWCAVQPGSRYDGWETEHGRALPCPYGKPGDRLWVRETWCPIASMADGSLNWNEYGNSYDVYYRADGVDVIAIDGDGFQIWNKDDTQASPWRPSIHMPRWASRITLEVVDVRVQRVREITSDDCIAEGIVDDLLNCYGPGCPPTCNTHGCCGIRDTFCVLWDSINLKRPGCSWADNPWVWAITFKRIEEGAS